MLVTKRTIIQKWPPGGAIFDDLTRLHNRPQGALDLLVNIIHVTPDTTSQRKRGRWCCCDPESRTEQTKAVLDVHMLQEHEGHHHTLHSYILFHYD